MLTQLSYSQQPFIQVNRIDILESLRGVLALWVLCGHCLAFAGWDIQEVGFPFSIMLQGNYPVEIFMILSGFVIFLLLDTKVEGYASYITRRFFRIYPVYIICVLLAFFTLDQANSVYGHIEWESSNTVQSRKIIADTLQNNVGHLVAHLFLLHGLVPNHILPSSDFAILEPAWSLSLEWQFYLVAPIIMALLKRHKNMILLFLLLLVAELFEVHRMAFLVLQAEYFAVGIASYYFWKNRKRIITHSFFDSRALFYGFVCTTYVLTKSPSLAIWSLFLFILATQHREYRTKESIVIERLFSLNWVRYLGTISYSIYLFHMIVLYFVAYYFIEYLKALDQISYSLLMLVSVAASTIFVSYISYIFIERPSIALGSLLAKRLANISVGANSQRAIND